MAIASCRLLNAVSHDKPSPVSAASSSRFARAAKFFKPSGFQVMFGAQAVSQTGLVTHIADAIMINDTHVSKKKRKEIDQIIAEVVEVLAAIA